MEWFQSLAEQNDKAEIPAIDNMPDIYPDLAYIWKAFNELSRYRAITFGGIGFIPGSEIYSWLNEEGYYGEEREELKKWIAFLDIEYVSMKNKEDSKKTKSSGGRRAGPPARPRQTPGPSRMVKKLPRGR